MMDVSQYELTNDEEADLADLLAQMKGDISLDSKKRLNGIYLENDEIAVSHRHAIIGVHNA